MEFSQIYKSVPFHDVKMEEYFSGSASKDKLFLLSPLRDSITSVQKEFFRF